MKVSIRVMKWLSILWLCVILSGLIAGFFVPSVDSIDRSTYCGCFWTDALVIEVKCQKFNGSKVAEFWLNLWLYLFYAPMFGIYALMSGEVSLAILPLGFTIATWTPILFLAWRIFRRVRARLTSTPPLANR